MEVIHSRNHSLFTYVDKGSQLKNPLEIALELTESKKIPQRSLTLARFGQRQPGTNSALSDMVDAFRNKVTVTSLLEKHNPKFGGPGDFAMLHAHGGTFQNQWCLADGETPIPIQLWVDNHDGERELLIIFACNPDKFDLSSKRSKLLCPRGIFGLLYLCPGTARLRYFDPNLGYF